MPLYPGKKGVMQHPGITFPKDPPKAGDYRETNFWFKELSYGKMYRPQIEFARVEGATQYQYTILKGRSFSTATTLGDSFVAESTSPNLTEIWKDLPFVTPKESYYLLQKPLDNEGNELTLSSIVYTAFKKEQHFSGPAFANFENQAAEAALIDYLRFILNDENLKNFRSDATVSDVKDGSKKNSNNPPQIAYSVIVAASLLARLSTDENEKMMAKQMAIRAGDWLLAKFGGPWDLPGAWFKTNAYMTLWSGHALIDLYTFTRDQKWKDAAIRMGTNLLGMQTANNS